MYRKSNLLKRASRFAVLLAALALALLSARADTRVATIGDQAVLFSQVSKANLSSAITVFIASVPQAAANVVFSCEDVTSATGCTSTVTRFFGTYDSTVTSYTGNTQDWTEIAYQGVGIGTLSAGVTAHLIVGAQQTAIPLGSFGFKQIAVLMQFPASADKVTGILTFANGAIPFSADNNGHVWGATWVGSPLFSNTGGAAVPPAAPLIVGTISSSNTLLPLQSDVSGKLLVDTSQTGNSSNPAIANTAFDNELFLSSFADNSGTSRPLAISMAANGGNFSATGGAGIKGVSLARTATVFKTVQVTASGNTAIWTPGAGNKFRLLGYRIDVTQNAILGAAGIETITMQDGTSDVGIAQDCFLPAASAPATDIAECTSGPVQLGSFGILSATASNVLNVHLSTAITGGNVRVNVWGTEE